jgi:flavin-dependent dehydrogenase
MPPRSSAVDGRFDVAVVGGGPAGLATAIFAARAGLSTVVLERSSGPADKACGEGLMPAGVRVLEALGVRERIGAADCSPFLGIRYVQEDGSFAEGRLPSPGLGIRRTALTSALAQRADECGVAIRWGCAVEGFRTTARAATVTTADGEVPAQLIVAADGLHSRLRRLAGLDRPTRLPQRLGLRQHFRVAPWSEFVEVHLGDAMEAFVTPAGASRVGVAFLWERDAVPGSASFDTFLRRFPLLAARLADEPADSRPRGAGPLAQGARSRIAERFVLVGDSAGYIDAITGEGVSLAFACAQALGAILPAALERGATRESLIPYERAAAREFRRYALVCRSVLALARRPRLRRSVLHFLGAHPHLFDRLTALALA